jgi:uncharacterized protein YigA (DUF484 family)
LITADDVARYLQANPKFFEDYHDLLAHLHVPHPHGGRAISITERQILTLREKSRSMEHKLAELIRFGEENDAIGEKVHRLGLGLMAAENYETLVQALYALLNEDFAVPHVAMRLWNTVLTREGPEFAPVSDETHAFAGELSRPYCGTAGDLEAHSWFRREEGDGGERVRSVALIPLKREAQTVGLLALGSEDPQRFYAEMGTLYLSRIGEMVSVALLRELG